MNKFALVDWSEEDRSYRDVLPYQWIDEETTRVMYPPKQFIQRRKEDMRVKGLVLKCAEPDENWQTFELQK